MKEVEAFLATECALTKDRPVVVGVSGGADSLCLMGALREAGYPLIAAHFDHQIREESARDAQTVKEICAALRVECRVESAPVGAHAAENKLSLEEAARKLRYSFLFRLARAANAQAVAVGHTADDQAETILMHILRGSALHGLQGMSPRAVLPSFDAQIPLVRPLLRLTRAETVAYCRARGLAFVHDSSNDSLAYRRNRIRLQLLPLLETYNPQIRQALNRLAQAASAELQILDSLEDSLWRDCAARGDGFVALDLSRLANGADVFLKRLILRAMRSLSPELDAAQETLNRAAAEIKSGKQGRKTSLQGGLYLLREGAQVYVVQEGAQPPLPPFPQMEGEMEARLPFEARLKNGWTFQADYAENFCAAEIFAKAKRSEIWLDADAVAAPLRLRTPRAGDWFRPLGMNGRSQKLSDFFVNEKIPRRARAGWVLLCAGEEIVWVAGLRLSHSFRVTEKTRRAIHAVCVASVTS